ncbi:C4-dicarboxylate transporter DcuA [Klebsiella pneumoniae]|uniref:C4-dicarboxylate transporter DcuA n=1 Tax=Klebsiella pneumoniae TaxID=573 RepID=A0A377ZS91_KLEPN|nr:C4-dicarboxylate transporter DcuA [Klebsiella pneumoniae]
MAVIAAIRRHAGPGGMDYLVSLAERMLRRHPKYITFLAPLVTWFMTVLRWHRPIPPSPRCR